MSALDQAEIARLKQEVQFWQNKFYRLLVGGVQTASKAIGRLKRKNDLKWDYVLANEKLLEALHENTQALENMPPQLRLAWTALQEKREKLGLIKKPRPEQAPFTKPDSSSKV